MGWERLREIDGVWAGARSVEVGSVRPDSGQRNVLVGDAAEIAELAGLLEVVPTSSAFVCMCAGDVRFTVRGERGKILGELTHHLGGGVEWHRWGGERPLLRPSELARWPAERGVADASPAQVR
ncbi:hypothetical protein [Streptomyces paromomycinus]|uniref:Uncharacterized protein n=1 Tax=Streptomyces paromomycinus TaxID=92743 RepID=A0A401VZS8_STREY|nr:hypothetical protein [Streptomyces paromomycinus]GCD42531.1 hypothetical protein GKJPGBOP_02195 [Streptomyces paromomycinus]